MVRLILGMLQFHSMSLQLLFLCFLLLPNACSPERVIQTFSGTIGAGNYTYFSLHEQGEISLIVHSLVGDADIYVSETVSKPTYLEYDLQSSTCGFDVVTVPATFKRPVGIALYGHVHSPISKYRLTAVLDYAGEESSSFGSVNTWTSTFSSPDEHSEDGDEEGASLKSILWTILVGFLKILVEIIT